MTTSSLRVRIIFDKGSQTCFPELEIMDAAEIEKGDPELF